MKIAFFGSPEIAKKLLKSIHEKHPVSLVISQPDKPIGRKKVLTPTAVSQYAQTHEIPLKTPESPQSLNLTDIDLAIVVAYGEIIPKHTLEIPQYGFINVHYSLLPKYRGASPVQWAILNGEKQTGITITKMDEELDHGPILATKTVSIAENNTTGSLFEKLTSESKSLLLDTIDYIQFNKTLPNEKVQDHESATYSRRLTKEDGFIDFSTLKKGIRNEQLTIADLPRLQQEIFKQNNIAMKQYSNVEIHNFIRSLNPWPMVWTILPNGKRCKIISSYLEKSALVIDEVQIEGKEKNTDLKLINILFGNI